jgi:hypothetical protein
LTSLSDIVLGVVTDLNGGTFAKSFTAASAFAPQFELTDMAPVQVLVVPKAETVDACDRIQSQLEFSVDVGIQTRYATDSDLDVLIRFAESLGRFFVRKRLSTVPAAAWVKTEHGNIYVPKHLTDLRVFTSIFTLTFRVIE